MAEQKKRSFGKEYLKHFQRDAAGRYVYMGPHKVYSDKNGSWVRENIFLWICCALPAALLIVLGLIPESGLAGNALIMAPYALSVLALFIVIWKLVRFSYAGTRMRKYVYDQTAQLLPLYSFISAGLGAAAVICMIITLSLGTYSGSVISMVLYFITGAVLAAGGAVIAVRIRKLKWENEF